MTFAGLVFIVVSISFVLLYTLVALEQQRGQRLVASALRDWLDQRLDRTWQLLGRTTTYLQRHVLAWSWYVSVHLLLRSALYVVVKLYDQLEQSFHRTRRRTKELHEERTRLKHDSVLAQVAAHKETTALTEAEKRSLRKKSLEGR